MGLRHVVLLRFAEHATDQQIDALTAGLDALPGKIPQIRSYRHGRDLDLSPTSWDYGLVAEFDSPADLQVYRDHPDHQALLQDLIAPISADRASVQLPL